MKASSLALIFLLVSLLFSVSCASSFPHFVKCFDFHNHGPQTTTYDFIYTPCNSSYSQLLQTSIQNLRFNSSTTPKPQIIVTPLDESHVESTILCSRKLGLQVRVRSGDHDYEGLSYASTKPFVLIDLVNLRKVDVNVTDNSAWVQAGANLGEVYYYIANKSPVHAWSAGVCPSIGVGGHISGGGQGTIMRKFGLAADNVIDARIVDAKGRILDRKSMGEDLFWAIRGGGGGSFGIILSWKIQLVNVPPVVTVFTPKKTLNEGAIELINRWQEISHEFDENLFIRILLLRSNLTEGGHKVAHADFNSLFLGTTKELLPLMNKSFPELGLKAEECTEMPWIETIKYFQKYPQDAPIEILLNRTRPSKSYFKAKSDFVKTPIPIDGLRELWKLFLQNTTGVMVLDPYGGRIGNISASATPFPHRGGTLYNIQYIINWYENDNVTSTESMNWLSEVYNYMTPYVSNTPRSSYVNYKDLDLGRNVDGDSTYSEAIPWGTMYFGENFERLAKVKAIVDPENFFKDEQSIPVFSADSG